MKHGTYFIVQNQKINSSVDLTYGKKEKDSVYTIPLKTLESNKPAMNGDTSKFWRSVRYFKKIS